MSARIGYLVVKIQVSSCSIALHKYYYFYYYFEIEFLSVEEYLITCAVSAMGNKNVLFIIISNGRVSKKVNRSLQGVSQWERLRGEARSTLA